MTATIVPFPTKHRHGRIRHVAGILQRKRGADFDRYWRQTVLVMRRQMVLARVDDEIIEQQIRDFADAVFAKLPDRRPRGAA